jgi:hypothetical protein
MTDGPIPKIKGVKATLRIPKIAATQISENGLIAAVVRHPLVIIVKCKF